MGKWLRRKWAYHYARYHATFERDIVRGAQIEGAIDTLPKATMYHRAICNATLSRLIILGENKHRKKFLG